VGLLEETGKQTDFVVLHLVRDPRDALGPRARDDDPELQRVVVTLATNDLCTLRSDVEDAHGSVFCHRRALQRRACQGQRRLSGGASLSRWSQHWKRLDFKDALTVTVATRALVSVIRGGHPPCVAACVAVVVASLVGVTIGVVGIERRLTSSCLF